MRTFIRVNHQIRVPTVRCIGDNGELIGIVPISQALNMANAAGLDLVEISPNAQPPVCRIMNVGKYKYEVEKKERESRKHQTHTKVKEVKFHANTDTHDFDMKVKHIRDFITDGHRVKCSLMFRGREQAHQELGYDVMSRVAKNLEDVATGDRSPQKMGRTLNMMFAPRPGKPLVAAKPPPPAAAPAAASAASAAKPAAAAAKPAAAKPAAPLANKLPL